MTRRPVRPHQRHPRRQRKMWIAKRANWSRRLNLKTMGMQNSNLANSTRQSNCMTKPSKLAQNRIRPICQRFIRTVPLLMNSWKSGLRWRQTARRHWNWMPDTWRRWVDGPRPTRTQTIWQRVWRISQPHAFWRVSKTTAHWCLPTVCWKSSVSTNPWRLSITAQSPDSLVHFSCRSPGRQRSI